MYAAAADHVADDEDACRRNRPLLVMELLLRTISLPA